MLNMFRVLLCPSPGARDYMCVVAEYGVQCLGCWWSEVRCKTADYASGMRYVARLRRATYLFQQCAFCYYTITTYILNQYTDYRSRKVLKCRLYCKVDILNPHKNLMCVCPCRPPLWSSGQSFWLQIQRSRVRFPALPDFLSSSWSGTGSTQPREVN